MSDESVVTVPAKRTKKSPGRKPGVPNKKSEEFRQKLDRLNCDPEEFLALVMTGKEASIGDHPFKLFLDSIQREFEEGQEAPTVAQWARIMETAERELDGSQATLDQRITIATKLMPFLRPTYKSIEHSVEKGTPTVILSLPVGIADGSQE